MNVGASEVAAFLGKPLVGPDVPIRTAKPVTNPEANCLVFAKTFGAELVESLNAAGEILVLAIPEYGGLLTASHIITPNPRLDFARVLQRFSEPRRASGVADTTQIAATARLGKNVSVGHFSVIGENVLVGDNTEIGTHVVIWEDCVIGSGCLVKPNTVIGEKGFGFERDDDGTPVCIPHLGRVIIGDEVEIGAHCTVARGTLDDTVVSDHVKVDDHVHIAHNVFVGRRTIITACAEISGSVRIGERCWIAPNASITNGVSVGDEAMVGIGAVVTKSVRPGVVVAGNPARKVSTRSQSQPRSP